MTLASPLGSIMVLGQVFAAPGQVANLIDQNHIWKPFESAMVSQTNDNLTIKVIINNTHKIFNRAFLQTQLNSTTSAPLILSIDYASNIFFSLSTGKPIFIIEIRGDNSSKILWDAFLNNTSGKLSSTSFLLPGSVKNKPVELRLYIITERAPSHSVLSIKKIQVMQSTKENIAQLLNSERLTTYNLIIGNKTYAIRYDIYGGKISNITPDINQTKLRVNINSTTNGILIIELARNLIDAKKQLNIDGQYSVLVDGQITTANEIQNSSQVRVLAVDFRQGNKQVEIIGTPTASQTLP